MAEENRSAAPEQELSEILQIRRDKLKALQDAGRDPFQITRFDRTVWSADILEHYEDYEGTKRMILRIPGKNPMMKTIYIFNF